VLLPARKAEMLYSLNLGALLSAGVQGVVRTEASDAAGRHVAQHQMLLS
jgi:hypothetical protein